MPFSTPAVTQSLTALPFLHYPWLGNRWKERHHHPPLHLYGVFSVVRTWQLQRQGYPLKLNHTCHEQRTGIQLSSEGHEETITILFKSRRFIKIRKKSWYFLKIQLHPKRYWCRNISSTVWLLRKSSLYAIFISPVVYCCMHGLWSSEHDVTFEILILTFPLCLPTKTHPAHSLCYPTLRPTPSHPTPHQVDSNKVYESWSSEFYKRLTGRLIGRSQRTWELVGGWIRRHWVDGWVGESVDGWASQWMGCKWL